jgi:phosphatidylserine decarboxylase
MRRMIQIVEQRSALLAKRRPEPPQSAMLFSKKTILKGRKPLRAASRVINASFPTASSAFARCWVHGTNTTSAIFRTVRNQGLRRVYSTKSSDPNPNVEGGPGLPLYRACVHWWP